MAFTKTLIHQESWGSKRTIIYEITADAATGVVTTDLDTVTAVWATPQSMASAPFSIKPDELCAGTASAGSVGITGVTSGDLITVVCLGR